MKCAMRNAFWGPHWHHPMRFPSDDCLEVQTMFDSHPLRNYICSDLCAHQPSRRAYGSLGSQNASCGPLFSLASGVLSVSSSKMFLPTTNKSEDDTVFSSKDADSFRAFSEKLCLRSMCWKMESKWLRNKRFCVSGPEGAGLLEKKCHPKTIAVTIAIHHASQNAKALLSAQKQCRCILPVA